MALRAYSTTDHDSILAYIEELGYTACLNGMAALLKETSTNSSNLGSSAGVVNGYLSASQRVTACAKEVAGILASISSPVA
mgnify:CR=1 FL=1